MSEIWKDVVGFNGLYLVSDLGRVISKHGRGTPVREIALQVDKKTGYVFACLSIDGKDYRKTVHRLVLEAFVGPCPDGMECCHEDGCRTNNALSNLRWDTRLRNHADKAKHGTDFSGERNPACKISETLAREIKMRLKGAGYGAVSELAREFDVKRSLVSDIKSGRTWAHI